MSDTLRFPIGRFTPPAKGDYAERVEWIRAIAELPAELEQAVAGLSDEHLDTPYRPDGWTIRQVVHHIADSHMNSYVRFRLAVTEDTPTIKPYAEARWAELKDARNAPLEPSMAILRGLHDRWVLFLRTLDEAELNKSYNHPESGPFELGRAIALYAWHGRHHVAHITSLREREGW